MKMIQITLASRCLRLLADEKIFMNFFLPEIEYFSEKGRINMHRMLFMSRISLHLHHSIGKDTDRYQVRGVA